MKKNSHKSSSMLELRLGGKLTVKISLSELIIISKKCFQVKINEIQYTTKHHGNQIVCIVFTQAICGGAKITEFSVGFQFADNYLFSPFICFHLWKCGGKNSLSLISLLWVFTLVLARFWELFPLNNVQRVESAYMKWNKKEAKKVCWLISQKTQHDTQRRRRMNARNFPIWIMEKCAVCYAEKEQEAPNKYKQRKTRREKNVQRKIFWF